MKVVRGLVLVGVIVMFLMADVVVDSGDYEYKIVNYVALGDSIAKGYGLQDVEKDSYVGRVATVLEKRYGAVELTNLAENGLRSEQLLDILINENHEMHRNYMEKIQEADIITLSIGSNDLLRYVSMDMDFEKFRERGDEIFTEACCRFQENIAQIIEVLQKEAPQAQIFANNVYNPCNDVSFEFTETFGEDLDEYAERYINKLNTGFQQEQLQEVFANANVGKEKGQCIVIDVKEAFDKSDTKLINMAFRWGDVDPHPNVEGHKRISELIISRVSLEK